MIDMSRADVVERLIDRVSYKPGTILHVEKDARLASDGVHPAHVIVDVVRPSVCSVRKLGSTLGFACAVPYAAVDAGDDAMLACLRADLLRSEEHEMNEWFRLDDRPVVAPHPLGEL